MKEVPELKPFDINYSLRNIPVGSKQSYMIKMYEMTNKFINRIRWKVHYYEKRHIKDQLGNEDDEENNEYFRFPGKRYGPWSDKLAGFEKDLFNMVKNIKFRRSCDGFQKTLSEDVKRIKNSTNVIAFSDKTNNLYEMDPHEYKKILVDNITKEYKKCSIDEYFQK